MKRTKRPTGAKPRAEGAESAEASNGAGSEAKGHAEGLRKVCGKALSSLPQSSDFTPSAAPADPAPDLVRTGGPMPRERNPAPRRPARREPSRPEGGNKRYAYPDANRWEIGTARGRFELETAGLLVVTASGVLTVSALECLRDLILARYRRRELGAVLMDVQSCVLAFTSEGLDLVQRGMPKRALDRPVGWCVISDAVPMIDAHADRSVEDGAMRSVFDSRERALLLARTKAAVQLAQDAWDARKAQRG